MPKKNSRSKPKIDPNTVLTHVIRNCDGKTLGYATEAGLSEVESIIIDQGGNAYLIAEPIQLGCVPKLGVRKASFGGIHLENNPEYHTKPGDVVLTFSHDEPAEENLLSTITVTKDSSHGMSLEEIADNQGDDQAWLLVK